MPATPAGAAAAIPGAGAGRDLVGLVRQLGGAQADFGVVHPAALGSSLYGPVDDGPDADRAHLCGKGLFLGSRDQAQGLFDGVGGILEPALDHGQLGLEQMERTPELDVRQRRCAGSDLFE